MKTIQINDYKEIMKFINDADDISASYLYKLQQNSEDVEQYIRNTIEDPGVFAQIDDQDQIQMLLLPFKYDDNKYKVIGPFIRKGEPLSLELFQDLFKSLTESKPEEVSFNFSFIVNEQDYTPMMKAIEAGYNFTDYHLIATKDVGTTEHEQNIAEYHPSYYRAFQKLHAHTFKHGAMTADEIVNSLDDNNKLYVFMSEGLLKGYLYLQVYEDNHNAEVKYFTSHSDYRMKGIAFDLLTHALHYAFQHFDINIIYFKIRSKNNKLVERFNELGFNVNVEYKKFKFVSSHV